MIIGIGLSSSLISVAVLIKQYRRNAIGVSVASFRVVEHFDVIKDVCTSFLTR